MPSLSSACCLPGKLVCFFFDATQIHQGRRPAILHSLVSGKRCDGMSLNGCRLHSCSINLEAGCSQEHNLFSQQKGRLFFYLIFFSPMELIFPTSSFCAQLPRFPVCCMGKKKKKSAVLLLDPFEPTIAHFAAIVFVTTAGCFCVETHAKDTNAKAGRMWVESYDVGGSRRVRAAGGRSGVRQTVSRAPTGPRAGVCVTQPIQTEDQKGNADV